MEFDFDTILDRASTDSLKWRVDLKRWGRSDVLPLWVADMDFACPPCVLDAVRARAEHPVYGYPERSGNYGQSIARWMEKRHGWRVDPEWIVYSPGVVPALHFAVQAFTRPGDAVVIQPPVYHPFPASIEINGRKVLENPLVRGAAGYSMDLEGLRSVLDEGARLLILCSPHNPVGRVWRRDELEALVEFCAAKGVTIISDEIHSDLVLYGAPHVCTADLSEAAARITVCLTAPSKTFNIAGFTQANAIIPDPDLRRAFASAIERSGIEVSNIFGNIACEAAYSGGEAWLDALLDYLRGNYAFIAEFAAKRLPGIEVLPLEGSYLAWLDCSKTGREPGTLMREAGVWLNEGSMFGTGGAGFLRLNFACPRKLLEQALERLAAVLA